MFLVAKILLNKNNDSAALRLIRVQEGTPPEEYFEKTTQYGEFGCVF